jgi:hypothetical protein
MCSKFVAVQCSCATTTDEESNKSNISELTDSTGSSNNFQIPKQTLDFDKHMALAVILEIINGLVEKSNDLGGLVERSNELGGGCFQSAARILTPMTHRSLKCPRPHILVYIMAQDNIHHQAKGVGQRVPTTHEIKHKQDLVDANNYWAKAFVFVAGWGFDTSEGKCQH